MKVAEHLSASYGDKAFKVARLAQLTGKRWPVVGRKLHDDYPYIEAEVHICQLSSSAVLFDRLTDREKIRKTVKAFSISLCIKYV